MPAMLDDPSAPVVPRTSGAGPFLMPMAPLPDDIAPRQVTLRDRVTTATLIPFSSPDQVPLTLVSYLCDQLNSEIENGDTYPMIAPLALDVFGPYWFANFGAVMLLGDIESAEQVREISRSGCDWEKFCLGSFYIKPNYPGRSSHVCNGGFIVTPAARNRGVGRLMGEGYLAWAPKLGYTYSVFNLVYETNVASCRIWDALGFKRIGRVKGCGNLKSYPDEYIDAIIYGRDLGQDEDSASEERFDKIKYYLKHGKYPNGADRAEKSRLRSAATHYKLIPPTATTPERLMLKGKEVISDPQRQYEIARNIHISNHGGINKSTAAIAEKFHWVRIKETVSAVIKNCGECSDASKAVARPDLSYKRTPSAKDPPSTGNTPSKQTALAPVTPATFGGLTTTEHPYRNHFSTPQTVPPAMAQDPSLSAVMHFNATQARGEMPLDPRLIDTMHMQQQVAQPPVAPVPQMIAPSRNDPTQYQNQNNYFATQPVQTQPGPASQRPVRSASTRQSHQRSASPSAQLLQEQEMTPLNKTDVFPAFPEMDSSGPMTRKRGRASDVGPSIGDSSSAGRETRKRRSKR